MERGHSEVIEYFIKNLKIDTTKFNEVCYTILCIVRNVECYKSGWGYC